ncbi:MAG: methylenetetrahydrofolate--tRNA-(uracil(54)-C(5))-methyltransferase (FADH(2)-oxidizing) TrmFO [Oscillospiraceae bacterium]|nr:methylenetetrahydrofolate--tRNA-(uracil(54)-C(5))-methyltransferase (FADH(2)-oxidizing) TrmFO [Oscillospiraceae bacterium]
MKAAVIGGGLAGVECAKALSRNGITVDLFEMKPKKYSPAHKIPTLAELVCSNSLKAERLNSAAGLLKAEMAYLHSICVETAYECRTPAGGALAVDRYEFSRIITEKIKADENINIIEQEVTVLPSGYDGIVICAGPLASEGLSKTIQSLCGDGLSFFDAAAPIISADSIDMSAAFTQSRYDRGGEDDYINCPLNKEEYEAFYEAIISAESAEIHSFDKRKDVYEGCMPIEVLASRGKDTMRYGPLKPVGLTDPRTGHRPWANLQLRKENRDGTMYNLVGFQTNLKFSEQKRIFSMFPALKNADFVRYGVMHRNTFIDSPRLLSADFSMRSNPLLFFGGQITGVEGYMESAASGILAGENLARRLLEKETLVLPEDTMIGALSRYISDETVKNFQPMGAAFGIVPPPTSKIRDKQERYTVLANRAMESLRAYMADK